MITVRIPKKLREEMKKYDLNWSEIIRRAIEREIRRIKMEEAFKKLWR